MNKDIEYLKGYLVKLKAYKRSSNMDLNKLIKVSDEIKKVEQKIRLLNANSVS